MEQTDFITGEWKIIWSVTGVGVAFENNQQESLWKAVTTADIQQIRVLINEGTIITINILGLCYPTLQQLVGVDVNQWHPTQNLSLLYVAATQV